MVRNGKCYLSSSIVTIQALEMEVLLRAGDRPDFFVAPSLVEFPVEYRMDDDNDVYAFIGMPIDHPQIYAEVQIGESHVDFGYFAGLRIYFSPDSDEKVRIFLKESSWDSLHDWAIHSGYVKGDDGEWYLGSDPKRMPVNLRTELLFDIS